MITESQKSHGHSGKFGFLPKKHTKDYHLNVTIRRSDTVGGHTVGSGRVTTVIE